MRHIDLPGIPVNIFLFVTNYRAVVIQNRHLDSDDTPTLVFQCDVVPWFSA